MTGGLTELEVGTPSKYRNRSPIHFHLPEESPVFLHFDGEKKGSKASCSGSSQRSKQTFFPTQVPWVPPPAKTSSGKVVGSTPASSGRRRRSTSIRRSGSTASVNPMNGDAKRLITDQIPDNESPDCVSTEVESVEIGIKREPDDSGSPRDHRKSPKNTNGSYQNSNGVQDECLRSNEKWIEDMDSAIKDMECAFRDLEECLDQLVMEGRKITLTDLGRLNRIRDTMHMNSKVALRMGREICRLANTTRSQAEKPRQVQDGESLQVTDVRILNERLEKFKRELEDSQRQLQSHRTEVAKFSSVNDSLESLKSHLQRELRQRESECNRLNAQLRSLESKMSEERAILRTQLQVAEDNLVQMRETKEALKRAARAQRKRADQAEAALSEAMDRLAANEPNTARSEDTDHPSRQRDRHLSGERKTSRSHSRQGSQTSRPRIVRELSSRSASPTSAVRDVPQGDTAPEEGRQSQSATNESCQQRLEAAEHEVNELRSNLAECESMLDNYRHESELQSERLHALTEELRQAEEARGRSQERLDEIEQRLAEAEAQNRALLKAIEVSTNAGHSEESPRTRRASANGQPTRRSNSHAHYDQGANHGGSDQTALIEELRKEIADAKKEREQAENRAEMRIADLRAQLSQADATNHSLQAYLTFLKRSYASVFQPELTGDTNIGISVNDDSMRLGSYGHDEEPGVPGSSKMSNASDQ